MENQNSKIEISKHPIEEPLSDECGQLSLDIYEHNGLLVILAPIAGTTADEIKITLTKDTLSIQGHRRKPEKVEEYLTEECFWGKFSRSIILPTNIDSEKIAATFQQNLLKITIPKREVQENKVIEIQ